MILHAPRPMYRRIMKWRNVTRTSLTGQMPLRATPLSTPLLWVGGAALLMVSLWLTGIIAIARGLFG